MYVKLVTTDGGAHSPETLAGMATQRFVDDFEVNAPSAAYQEVMRFRGEIDKILTLHHREFQASERQALRDEGSDRLLKPIDTAAAADGAVNDILALMQFKAAEFPTLKDYFRRPETKQYFHDILHAEFHHNAWIERSWHAQGHVLDDDGVAEFDAAPENAEHPAAKAFLAHAADGHALLTRSDEELEEHGGREAVLAIVTHSIPGPKPEPAAEPQSEEEGAV